ncbi:MAG: helix-turn-helix domain-containing protein [Coleofasciculus sp. G3-WIS-01]|uniref:helix-turn-helix domain-containing protein n=1 Tax=Coleofasciculus sp. G3-WIS-01 TaxID=3069528 RepID=UPI0032FA11D1
MFKDTLEICETEKINELNEFISNTLDVREWKRAEVVRLKLLGVPYKEITNRLGVSTSFIAKLQRRYAERGIEGIKLAYKGSKSYLTATEKAEITHWLNCPEHRNISDLKRHLRDNYDVVFKSKESYYRLLRESQLGRRIRNKPTLPYLG